MRSRGVVEAWDLSGSFPSGSFPWCYGKRAVRDRIGEFLGGLHARNSATAYITSTAGGSEYAPPASVDKLPEYLAAGVEINRSLWDRDSLIADIDLEYHNFDNPAAAWQDSARAFRLQQPVLRATQTVLGYAGVAPLALMSGRGFHLVWAIRRDSRAFERLALLGSVPPDLDARYARARSPGGFEIDLALGRAFAGLGKIFEFVFHRVLEKSRDDCDIPVKPAAIEVGPGINGREILSFDLSEYGDPLDIRHIRVPFSVYLKPRQYEWLLGRDEAERLLPMFEIPIAGMTLQEALAISRRPDAVAALSESALTRIPNMSVVMENLLDEYQHSTLAAFHAKFEADLRNMDPASDPLPPPSTVLCLAQPLEQPNDWLLKPGILQHVVRVLTAIGWRPSEIAHLIAASYLRDCDWGDTWIRLDPWNRAIFYTRLFTGMIATGADSLVDMNCVSHQEKGYCVVPDCSANLAVVREQLLQRRAH